MNELVNIRTFSQSSDFEIVKSYLESFGIECFGRDEITNRAYLANVNGGAKLDVRASQAEDAIRLLMDGGYLKPEDFEPTTEFKFVDRILSKFRKK